MSDTLKELERQVRSLTAEERARLAELLLESLRHSPLADIEALQGDQLQEHIAKLSVGFSPPPLQA